MSSRAVAVFLAAFAAADCARTAETPLPADGGAPGKAFRDYYAAAAAKDRRAMFRLTTVPAYFEAVSRLDQDATAGEIAISGTQKGDVALLEIVISRKDGPSTHSSKSPGVPMRLDHGQWKLATGSERPGPLPVVSFESAETVRKMGAIASRLEQYREADGSYPNAADVPALLKLLPAAPEEGLESDAWGRPLSYRLHQRGYFLTSLGADGTLDAGIYDGEGTPKDLGPVATKDPAADIILRALSMPCRYPEGTFQIQGPD